MKQEETVDFHIRWTWHKIARMYNSQASKLGGSMAMGFILLNIDKNGSPSTSLGPKMGMESRSLTRILRSMEELDLVERVHGEEDRRNVFIHLTEKGRKMRASSKATVIKYNQYLQDHIPAKKLETFFEVMGMINNMTDTDLVFPVKKKANKA